MKWIGALIFSILFLNCASKKQSTQNSSYPTEIGLIDKLDSTCLNEIAEAKTDFKKMEIYTQVFPEGYLGVKATRYFGELKELLKQRNIEFGWETVLESHKAYSGNSLYTLNYSCYQRTMNTLIDQKYGSKFISKLKNEADSLYVLRRSDEIFNTAHVDDTLIVYAKSKSYWEQRSEIQRDFFRGFKFPVGYEGEEIKKSFVADVQFAIRKDGSISDFIIKTKFENELNTKFKDYFEREIIAFLKSCKWQPSTAHNMIVHSYMNLTILGKQ